MNELFSFREGSLYCHRSLDEDPRPEDFPVHAHETPEIYLFLSGNGEYLVEGSRYPYNGLCATNVECCRIDRENLEKVLQDPMIALRVIGLLSRKLHNANERNLLLTVTDPGARIAGFLLYRSKRSASDTVTLRLGEIAASIHLRPETVSRRLKELERQGLIKRIGQSGIRLMDSDGLRKVFTEEA